MKSVQWALFVALLFGVSEANAQLSQSANALRFNASATTGGEENIVFVEFSTAESKISNETNSLVDDRWVVSEFGLDSTEAYFLVSRNDSLEGTMGMSIGQSTADATVYGGLVPFIPDPPPGEDYQPYNWSAGAGYVIRQSGSTWYGDLAMDTGTTFSADNLTANSIQTSTLQANTISSGSITTNSLQASSIRSNSLTTGVLTVTGNASIGGNLNMNNNRITNVGDGVEPTDAVNMGQLQSTETQISDLRKESRGGISGVAALAGIPSVPDGADGVLGFGVGTYKGESSLAIGASRRVNEKATIKFGISTTTKNNEVVGSFGIGIKW